MYFLFFFFFFFQAEDGIRDDLVTGVQTCALPIYEPCEFHRFGYIHDFQFPTANIPSAGKIRRKIPFGEPISGSPPLAWVHVGFPLPAAPYEFPPATTFRFPNASNPPPDLFPSFSL